MYGLTLYTYTYRLMGYSGPLAFVGTHIPGYSSADLVLKQLALNDSLRRKSGKVSYSTSSTNKIML